MKNWPDLLDETNRSMQYCNEKLQQYIRSIKKSREAIKLNYQLATLFAIITIFSVILYHQPGEHHNMMGILLLIFAFVISAVAFVLITTGKNKKIIAWLSAWLPIAKKTESASPVTTHDIVGTQLDVCPVCKNIAMAADHPEAVSLALYCTCSANLKILEQKLLEQTKAQALAMQRSPTKSNPQINADL